MDHHLQLIIARYLHTDTHICTFRNRFNPDVFWQLALFCIWHPLCLMTDDIIEMHQSISWRSDWAGRWATPSPLLTLMCPVQTSLHSYTVQSNIGTHLTCLLTSYFLWVKMNTGSWTDLNLLDIFGHDFSHILPKRCQLAVGERILRPDGGCMKPQNIR